MLRPFGGENTRLISGGPFAVAADIFLSFFNTNHHLCRYDACPLAYVFFNADFLHTAGTDLLLRLYVVLDDFPRQIFTDRFPAGAIT